MLLYHGTSSKRGVMILESGMLSIDAKRVYGENRMCPTTDGYVYLTNDLANAIYYANRTSVHLMMIKIYIFFK